MHLHSALCNMRYDCTLFTQAKMTWSAKAFLYCVHLYLQGGPPFSSGRLAGWGSSHRSKAWRRCKYPSVHRLPRRVRVKSWMSSSPSPKLQTSNFEKKDQPDLLRCSSSRPLHPHPRILLFFLVTLGPLQMMYERTANYGTTSHLGRS